MTSRQASWRIKFLGGIMMLCALLIIYRLYQVQIVNGEEFRFKAGSQYVRTSTDDFDRGSIFIKDNEGDKFPVATVASGYILAAHPAGVTDPQAAQRIYQVLSDNERGEFANEEEFIEYVTQKTADKDDPYEELLNKLSLETANKVVALDIEGINVYGQRWRHYPAKSLLSHVIGFMSYNDNDQVVGTYGIERQFDDQLQRKETSIFNNFFAEAFSTASDIRTDSLPSDIYLTIDRSAQIELEKVLKDTQTTWNSASSAGIIMDPKTGEIVAMATTPAFDLNNFSVVETTTSYSNPLISNVYEMGSIMKPLTMSYALDSNAVTQNTTYNDTGQLTVDKSTISNYDGGARGVVPMQEILNQSLNVGTAFLVNQMGRDKFKDYFKSSGFDSITNIDLPNEAYPLTESLLTSPRTIEYVTASFGQGFAVSPIAMTRALAILANDGKLPNPYVVERVQHEIGTWDDKRKKDQTQVISAKSAHQTTDMLVTVVDEALRGGEESLINYSIAAKTGTAQIANERGQYREDAYLHTFFGYFPAYNPKYLIFLMNEEPVGARYASETLTDPFMSLTKFLINYKNIEPDR